MTNAAAGALGNSPPRPVSPAPARPPAPWPTPQEYNEAIQNPHLNFADPELRGGQPELTPLGLPRAITGGFASVYRMRCGGREWAVDGRGGKDHSWGPRNWHAKIYLRWLIASFDDHHGFMLVRAVGPTKKTRSGFVWDAGRFHCRRSASVRSKSLFFGAQLSTVKAPRFRPQPRPSSHICSPV